MLAVVLANIKFSFYYLFISNLNYVEVLYIYIILWKKNKYKFNHSLQVLKQLPQTINRRLIKLSNNQESINNVKGKYQKALNSANFKDNLKYDKTTLSKRNKKQRKRGIIFFNPPFSLNICYKIGKQLLNLNTTKFKYNFLDENQPYK